MRVLSRDPLAGSLCINRLLSLNKFNLTPDFKHGRQNFIRETGIPASFADKTNTQFQINKAIIKISYTPLGIKTQGLKTAFAVGKYQFI
jgi:hypothetical protein